MDAQGPPASARDRASRVILLPRAGGSPQSHREASRDSKEVISPDARHRPGRKVAELLAGAWRLGVAACDSGASGIEEAESLLLGSGAGPLAFFRSPEREKFREAYRLSALHAVVREERTLA